MSAETATENITATTSVKPVIEERIYIGNVDYKATEDELKALFENLDVTEVEIPFKESTRSPNKTFKRHLGFAFVQFGTKEDADKAIEEYNGKKFQRRNIFIKKAVPPPTEEEKKERVEAYKAKKAAFLATKEEKSVKAKAAREEKAASTPRKKSTSTKTSVEKVPDGKPSTDTIFVTNLEYKVDVKALSNLFKDLKPKWIHVPTRRIPFYVLKKQQALGTERIVFNKGIAFVKFADEETQKQAVAEFQGKELNGREIIVDIAIDARIPKEEDIKALAEKAAQAEEDAKKEVEAEQKQEEAT